MRKIVSLCMAIIIATVAIMILSKSYGTYKNPKWINHFGFFCIR